MNTLDKIIGSRGCMLIVGHTATAIPTGYTAYAADIRIDDTAFASINMVSGGGAVTDITGLTWEGVALKRGDYVPFEYPVTSITLTNDADSVFAFLQ